MKTRKHQFFILVAAIVFVLNASAQVSGTPASFIIASDQREHATERFRSKQFTLGGFEAINSAGRGEFMITLGDIDPPQATKELIEQVLGTDYLWYPVVGNHDLEIESNTEFLRAMNRKPHLLPGVVRQGPPGCEETTYSFDWKGIHFVVLNVYFDGKSDKKADGTIAPELLSWLENDLRQTDKKRIFVFGHEPIFPFLDMDNGTVRHLGDALDKYPVTSLPFQQLLAKYKVTAYFSGHTHCASYANINGLWLINSGHLYGQEGTYTAETLFQHVQAFVQNEVKKGATTEAALKSLYTTEEKELKKFVFALGYGKTTSYKDLSEAETLLRMSEFYTACTGGSDGMKHYSSLFWQHTDWRKSTFLKILADENSATLQIYRDKGFEGDYALRHTQKLY